MHKTDSDFQAYFEKLKNATNEAQFEDVISFCESLEAQGRDLNALEYFYGYALLALNRDQAALKPLSRALKFFPNEVNLLNRIAICCRRLRNFGDASRHFERALSIEGNNEVLIVNYLVNLLEALQSDSAIQVATEALARFPANRMIRIQLATAYLNSWRPSDALKVLEPLKLTAQLGEVGLICMASCFVRLKQNDEARKVLLQLFELNPNSHEALALSAHVRKDAGEIEVATELYRQALDRLPQNHELFSSMLFCLLHDAEKTNDEILQAHREFSRRFESTLAKTAQFENEKSKNRKLRIGFISGDLCKHPVAAFVLPILSKFDSSRFELIAFNNSMQEDEYL